MCVTSSEHALSYPTRVVDAAPNLPAAGAGLRPGRLPFALGRSTMTDKTDTVIAIAASLFASRATSDELRAEQDFDALAAEAWDLYRKLERAVHDEEAPVGGKQG